MLYLGLVGFEGTVQWSRNLVKVVLKLLLLLILLICVRFLEQYLATAR